MITVYSTNCPKCKTLIKKLETSSAEFKVVDNLQDVLDKAEEVGIKQAPFMIVDGVDKVFDFTESLKYVRGL